METKAMSKEDWIIIRLLFSLLRTGTLKPDMWWRDANKSVAYLMDKYGMETVFAAIDAIEQEKGPLQ